MNSLRTLAEWARDPEGLEEDGLLPPSPAALGAAVRLVKALDSKTMPPLQWLVPNGDGGIVFEWRQDSFAEKIEILDDGSVTYAYFEHTRLMFKIECEIA